MSVNSKVRTERIAGSTMERKPQDLPAHYFDFKRWLLWGEHVSNHQTDEYPKDYPSPQDCLPDPENEFEVEGIDDGY